MVRVDRILKYLRYLPLVWLCVHPVPVNPYLLVVGLPLDKG